MTISRRKKKQVAQTEDKSAAAESGVQYHCDVCGLDISATVRISCATCATLPGAADTYDLCCSCFLEGAETGNHKPWHDYRVVEQHAYPIFCEDWGADEELLLIDGAQIYGLGNWADIADHIGNRTKEEVQRHYIEVYLQGRDGTAEGDRRAEEADEDFRQKRTAGLAAGREPPVVGPNTSFQAHIDAEEFQKRKRQRIDDLRSGQAAFGGDPSSSQAAGPSGSKPAPPKPLVSAPTSHSELAGFMPGRLEFESEYEQDAENYVKDMDFGKVYRYGGELIPSEMEALGRRAERGYMRMEASGRGGTGTHASKTGQNGTAEDVDGGDAKDKAAELDVEGTEAGDEADDEDKDDRDREDRQDDEESEQAEDDGPKEGDAMQTADQEGDQTQDTRSAPQTSSDNAAAAAASQPAETDDRAPDWDEDEADLDLKLQVLEIYNERLDRRFRRKEFVFARNLIDYKRTVAAERKRPKEARELLNRVRHFAQMQTAEDFEDFYNGLCYEDALRRAAAQLQMYRRAGITNLTDAARFDEHQAERARRAAVAAEGGLAAFPPGGTTQRSAARAAAVRDASTPDRSEPLHVPTSVAPPVLSSKKKKDKSGAGDDEKKTPRKPPKPLDLSHNPSLRLLTRAEQELCSVVRIQPQTFMVMKKEIIVEFQRRKGKFSRRESRQLFKCDVNKVGKVYDLLESEGYLQAAARLTGQWDGTGTPPGWIEPPPKPATPLANGLANGGTPASKADGKGDGLALLSQNGLAAHTPSSSPLPPSPLSGMPNGAHRPESAPSSQI